MMKKVEKSFEEEAIEEICERSADAKLVDEYWEEKWKRSGGGSE